MGFSEKQREILRFPYRDYDALICDGAVRSGKTSVMSLSFFLWAMGRFNGCAFALCGKSVGAVERNIVTPLLAVQYLRQNFTISYSRSGHVITARRGVRENRFYLFGGKDESSYTLIQGITLAGVLLDEVALMPRSFVEQALARCSVTGNKVWFSCNPKGPKHWFYREWILKSAEKNALRLHFEMTDNPALSEKVLEQYRARYTGVFYDWYVRGLWVDPTGRVYQDFDEKKHTTDRTPWLDQSGETRPGTEYYISVDYGILNPFSAGLWAVYKGVAYRWREYYYDGRKTGRPKTDEEHYAEIEKLAGHLPIESIVIDPSASSFKETVRRHDRFSIQNAVNDVLSGIATVSSLLKAGRLKIGASCKDCISEFGLYSWAVDKGDNIMEEVEKENDHAMDDARYFCHTILRREFDWLNWG